MTLKLIVSTSTNPYWNVSVENYLVEHPEDDSVVMYLWKNRRTVVIGQNQNPFSECNVDTLLADGGYVMRRTTGGGAVYHDDGNLNFSFVAPYNLYDQNRQFGVIIRALQTYGLRAELSGRNDLLVADAEGNMRKFSGNAFSKGRVCRLHHGTILIRGDMEDLKRYLKVKPTKLHKHGVQSVVSRVVNLSDLADVNTENIVPHLVAAFEEVYSGKVDEISFDSIVKRPEVVSLYEKYSSDEWIFGRWRTFTASKIANFEWGIVEMNVIVDEKNAVIKDVTIATDSLNANLSAEIRKLLIGSSTHKAPVVSDDEPWADQLRDIVSLIY